MKRIMLIVFLIIYPSVSKADIATGLVGWWKFDAGSGSSATDSSGNGDTGTLQNSPTWGAGKLGDALLYNGTNQYVTAASSVTLTSSFTLSAWVYPTSLSQSSNGGGVGGTIIESNENGNTNGYVLGIRNNNKIWWWPEDSADLFSTGTVSLNTWTLVVLTYDGTNTRMYINGSLDSTQAGVVPQVPTYLNFASKSWVTGYWDGIIDDIRIYSRTLSLADVVELYNVQSTIILNKARLNHFKS